MTDDITDPDADRDTDTATDVDHGGENPAIHGSESGGDESVAQPSGDDVRTIPELADQGKRVVDTHGEDLGIVSDVDGQTLYVEPDPSLTEKIMSTLHWREGDRDELKVPGDRILRIDDEVVLDLERDSEFRSEP